MDPTTLDLRIQNTKASIEKTKRTLERYEKQREKRSAALKAQGVDITQLSAEGRRAAQNGQNDLYWDIDALEDTIENIERNEKKLAELQEKLSGYREKKAAEDKRNDIPHIPALEDFLAQWKDKATEHYCLEVRELAAHQKERREKIKQIESKYEFPSIHWREIDEEAKAIGMDSKSFNKAMKMRFTQDIHRLRAEGLPGEPRFDQFLDKMLSDEVRSKRLDLYYRCVNAVGVLTDVSGLYVGNNGSLNGHVVGEQGKANVETIYAGGYNIQCLHYRVLVKPVREKESLDAQIHTATEQAARQPSGAGRQKDAPTHEL